MSKCEECPVAVRVTKSGQTRTLAWNDDSQRLDVLHRLSPPVFDDLGRAPLLVVNPAFVIKAYTKATAQATLQAAKGVRSLGKNSDFAAAVARLERLGALTAILSNVPQEADRGDESALLIAKLLVRFCVELGN